MKPLPTSPRPTAGSVQTTRLNRPSSPLSPIIRLTGNTEAKVPNPSNGYKIPSDHEICDWLQKWELAIDEETQVPPPDRTVNAADPISISRGLSDLVELLSEAVPRPAA